jgi:hypothetical protein
MQHTPAAHRKCLFLADRPAHHIAPWQGGCTVAFHHNHTKWAPLTEIILSPHSFLLPTFLTFPLTPVHLPSPLSPLFSCPSFLLHLPPPSSSFLLPPLRFCALANRNKMEMIGEGFLKQGDSVLQLGDSVLQLGGDIVRRSDSLLRAASTSLRRKSSNRHLAMVRNKSRRKYPRILRPFYCPVSLLPRTRSVVRACAPALERRLSGFFGMNPAETLLLFLPRGGLCCTCTQRSSSSFDYAPLVYFSSTLAIRLCCSCVPFLTPKMRCRAQLWIAQRW